MPLYQGFPYLLEKPESLEMEEESEKDVRDSQSKQLKEQLEALPRDKLAEGVSLFYSQPSSPDLCGRSST